MEPKLSEFKKNLSSASDRTFNFCSFCSCFVAQLTVKFVFLSVPIIATAVQEELEIGSASSGDAACASNTVKRGMLHLGKFSHLLPRLLLTFSSITSLQ